MTTLEAKRGTDLSRLTDAQLAKRLATVQGQLIAAGVLTGSESLDDELKKLRKALAAERSS
ncbi:hypothetical protein [Variovorax sp. PBL-E5]|uniref:hypothetical protein n=1 Tax=Variovorax sp. PBL-E5 TaxID=434014 RepID=UPI0013A5BB72|nr:hypothetical protein [Variovorax sp. PBL-E5]